MRKHKIIAIFPQTGCNRLFSMYQKCLGSIHLFISKVQPSVPQTTNQGLVYNEKAKKVNDLGAGPFERFDSSPELPKKAKGKKQNSSGNSAKVTAYQMSTKDEKIKSIPKPRKSSETGYHSGIL